MSIKSLRIWLALIVLALITSCVSIDCAYDTKIRPEPISVSRSEGIFFGWNYEACFVIDGVIIKEYIPECAYRYYHDKQNQ